MTSVRPCVYQDHLWYPILVKMPGSSTIKIIEMQGAAINAHNSKVYDEHRRTHNNNCNRNSI